MPELTQIYLDHHATTPVDPRVLERMLPWFGQRYGNPHSVEHAFGWDAERATEAARLQIALLIGARADEITFTSGATESNNLALLGLLRANGNRRHVVASPIEHASVEATLARAVQEGAEVTRVAVDADGLVQPDRIRAALRNDTALVTVGAANQEIGTLQPLAEIGALARQAGARFHIDAAQAAGKIPLDVEQIQADLLSMTAHKLYGPKGIGALYVRSGLRLQPLVSGGGQERGLRSGTVPTPLAVAFGAAAEIAAAEMADEATRLAALRDRLLARLRAAVPALRVHGTMERRLAANLNFALPGASADDMLFLVKDQVALSSGSACASAERVPSHVLRAIGLADEQALEALRIGLGRWTSAEQVDTAADALIAAYRSLSP